MSQRLAWVVLATVVLVKVGCVEVAPKVCYFAQEPDPSQNGRLRWLIPGTNEDHCSCTSIRRGGVNPRPLERPYTPYFTDRPLFTTDPGEIHDYFGCHVDGPADCQAVYDAGGDTSGVYTIYPSQYPDGLQVYCDMISHPAAHAYPPLDIQGGWLVFQRRQNGMVIFRRNWAGYRDGFGDLTGEFWLGNEKLRRLTEDGGDRWEMVVEFEDENVATVYALYEEFNITGDNYTLHVKFNSLHVIDGMYDPADDSFAQHNHRNFSTYDRDNDGDAGTNCADLSEGGWWFDQCDKKQTFNGKYGTGSTSSNYFGVWYDNTRIVKSEMKLRIRQGSD